MLWAYAEVRLLDIDFLGCLCRDVQSADREYNVRHLAAAAWGLATLYPEVTKAAQVAGSAADSKVCSGGNGRMETKLAEMFAHRPDLSAKQRHTALRELEASMTRAMAGIARRLTVQLEALGERNTGGCEGLFVNEDGTLGEAATPSTAESGGPSTLSNKGGCAAGVVEAPGEAHEQDEAQDEFDSADSFNEQDVANTAWAYVNFPSLERETWFHVVSRTDPGYYSALGLSQVMYALARVKHPGAALFGGRLQKDIIRRRNQFLIRVPYFFL